MTSYSLMQWFGKWIVVKATDDGRKSYLQSVHNGASVWYFDPTYARPYSHKTATQHLKDFRASDPECEEDF